MSGASTGFVLNTAIIGYVGPVSLNGTGSSTCESISSGGGPLTLTVGGTGPLESTLQCTNLTGGWTRTGVDLSAIIGGNCIINGGFTDPVNLIVRATWEPAGLGAGVTMPISSADFHMVFAFPPV